MVTPASVIDTESSRPWDDPVGARGQRLRAHRTHRRRLTPRESRENSRPASARVLATGPPPSARGKRLPRPADHSLDRLTPASAGRTPSRPTAAAASWAHPRERGEDWGREPRPGARVGLTPASAGRTAARSRPPRAARAHPRERGEDTTRKSICVLAAGSPPRARGGPDRAEDHRSRAGLTPASAGRTTRPRTSTGCSWAYPRERGEDMRAHTRSGWRAGSPPRARGGRHPGGHGDHLEGLTPASAGRTTRSSRTRAWSTAHPRERGEDAVLGVDAAQVVGSPPRARGGPGRHHRRDRLPGLTPASAGRTLRGWRRPGCGWAHPRERGEDTASARTRFKAEGSPPRARGGQQRRRRRRSGGLTPASAGRTRSGLISWPIPRAHPRERGEDPTRDLVIRRAIGSPPRARGGRRLHPPPAGGHGLTPASAGRTTAPKRRWPMPWAHPRERGEDRTWCACSASRRGSPPRARGGQAELLCLVHPVLAHPRERGEDDWSATGAGIRTGSPPRARGERSWGVCADGCRGSPPRARGGP